MDIKFVKTTLLKAVLLLLASGITSQLSQAQQVPGKNVSPKIEVVYFHAPNRCPSCVANETQTKEVKTDYTNTAFDYAFSEPEKYERFLQAEILNQLNSK